MTMQELANEAVQASFKALYGGVDRMGEWKCPEQQANVVKLACTLIVWSNGRPDIDIVHIEKQEDNQ